MSLERGAALTVLRGFAPWIIYAVVSGFSDDAWRWAAVAAVAAGILLILDDRRRGVKPDAQILEISAVVFFAVVAIVGFATDSATFHKYDSVLSFGWLALTAWVSLAIGKPFTGDRETRSAAGVLGIGTSSATSTVFSPRCGRWPSRRRRSWSGSSIARTSATSPTASPRLSASSSPISFTNWYKERPDADDDAPCSRVPDLSRPTA